MIVECGSITRASERLGITQPSLSQQLLRLEDELGISLFRRTARGVAPTEAGRLFQEHASNILQSMERAREEVHQLDREPRGDVGLALPASASQLLSVPMLVAARKKLPQVALRIRESMSGNIRRWLEEGRVDLAILYDAEFSRHLSVKRIERERLLLIGRANEFGPADQLGIAVAPVDLSFLRAKSLILPNVTHGLRRLIDRQSLVQDAALRVGIEIDSLSHIKTLVAAGEGYSLLPHSSVGDDLVAGRLSAARISDLDLSRSISIVRNPARTVTRASVEVEDLLLSQIHKLIASKRWLTEGSPQTRKGKKEEIREV